MLLWLCVLFISKELDSHIFRVVSQAMQPALNESNFSKFTMTIGYISLLCLPTEISPNQLTVSIERMTENLSTVTLTPGLLPVGKGYISIKSHSGDSYSWLGNSIAEHVLASRRHMLRMPSVSAKQVNIPLSEINQFCSDSHFIP